MIGGFPANQMNQTVSNSIPERKAFLNSIHSHPEHTVCRMKYTLLHL